MLIQREVVCQIWSDLMSVLESCWWTSEVWPLFWRQSWRNKYLYWFYDLSGQDFAPAPGCNAATAATRMNEWWQKLDFFHTKTFGDDVSISFDLFICIWQRMLKQSELPWTSWTFHPLACPPPLSPNTNWYKRIKLSWTAPPGPAKRYSAQFYSLWTHSIQNNCEMVWNSTIHYVDIIHIETKTSLGSWGWHPELIFHI